MCADTNPEKVARALYEALRQNSRDAFVEGEPQAGRGTIIDGTFDLQAVARRVSRALDAKDRRRVQR